MIRKYPKYITTYDKNSSLTLRLFLSLRRDNNKHVKYVVVLEDTAFNGCGVKYMYLITFTCSYLNILRGGKSDSCYFPYFH